MPFSLRSLSDYNEFVAVDIGSSRIKALICTIESGELKILAQSSMRQSRKHIIGGEISDLAGVSEAVKRTILKAAEGMTKLPQDIVVSINSSSLLFDSVGMNYVRDDSDRPIDMEEIDRMIASTETKSLERMKPKAESRLGLSHSDLRLITTSLTSILIDGKKVSNPIGFTGKNIRLSLINFFVSASTFSAFSLLVRDLGMQLISFVPPSVALPKMIEDAREWFESNALVDIGYSSITITLSDRSEILGSFVFPFGVNILEESLLAADPGLKSLHIEDTLIHPEKQKKEHTGAIREFYRLCLDSVQVAMEEVGKLGQIQNIFLSGGAVEPQGVDMCTELLEERPMGIRRVDLLLAVSKKDIPSQYASAYATALAAKEIISLKKDPIVRILRYVIYRYE